MRLSRRRTLQTVCATASVGIAGCLGVMPNGVTIAAEPVSVTPENGADVIVFSDLPTAEREMVRDAVETGAFQTCDVVPDAARSFAERLTPEPSYLRYRDAYYALYVRIQDVIYGGTADPPPDPDCDLL